MNMNLNRPLVFFDLETTGTDILSDRIVEISCLKVSPDASEEVKTRRINPGIPIPPGASAVHGITDEDVKDAPSFKSIARSLASWLKGCDLAGYNSNHFDIPLLAEEFERSGVDIDWAKRRFIDVQTVFHKKEQRTLPAALKFYCNRNLENAHSSEVDTKATCEVLEAQLDRYHDLQNDMDFLSKYSSSNTADLAGCLVYNDKGKEVFNLGKYKGRVVEEILRDDPSYCDWFIKAKFPRYTIKVFESIRSRMASV